MITVIIVNKNCHHRQADYNEACTPNPQLRVEDSELEGAVPHGLLGGGQEQERDIPVHVWEALTDRRLSLISIIQDNGGRSECLYTLVQKLPILIIKLYLGKVDVVQC